MIKIRLAVQADGPIILQLIHDLAQFENLSSEVKTDLVTLSESLFGPKASAEVLLAEVAGEVVGCAIFFHNFSTFLGRHGLYLEDLFVKPQSRGRGVGRELLSTLARIAVERGCGRMEWSVLNWNQKAIDLYTRIGATPQSEWTVFRLVDSVLLDLAAKTSNG